MKESFLHFIWKHQLFNKKDLQSVDGEIVSIINQGIYNTNSGPDFIQARILIGKVEWAGQVEVHLRSSDWESHKHSSNPAYDNVVLHVVWESDRVIRNKDGMAIPEIELKGKVLSELIKRQFSLLSELAPIPCHVSLPKISNVLIASTIDRTVSERLMQKAEKVMSLVEGSNKNWDEAFFKMLCISFGFKVNKDPFGRLSELVPLKVLEKNSDNLLVIEAILFGQAGFLPNSADSYFKGLSKEYIFQAKKYKLSPPMLPGEWKFMRMRPANFPTLRIAQLAALIKNEPNLFSFIRDSQSGEDIINHFRIKQSEYWYSHYLPAKMVKEKVPGIGKDSIHLLLINSVAPFLAAYSNFTGEGSYMEKAIKLLEMLPPEKNAIIRKWSEATIVPTNSSDTQGLVQLYNQWCSQKKCLECAIGYQIISGKS